MLKSILRSRRISACSKDTGLRAPSATTSLTVWTDSLRQLCASCHND